MPRIRIEWVPVQTFGLGLFGFDHLQLVYQPSEADSPSGQDSWFVMEGVREAEGEGAFLGIEGADGRTTLSVANLAARDALIAKIGTPEYRGSRALPYGGDEFQAWETMASYARDIEKQDFPYIAFGLPGSPTPTINSSSAIASLIYDSGLDPSVLLPYGMHLSPGMATRLGTSGDDAMRIECGFTTLLGGQGRDELVGGSDPHTIDKLYGGPGDDLFHWSAGFNIIHGGQPQLDYAADGTDTVDYSGAGTVTISFNRHWIPHKTPNYIAVFADGRDHLYSIERIQWNATTDRIVLGDGVDLVEDDIILRPGAHSSAEPDAQSHLKSGRLIDDSAHVPLRSAADYALPDDVRDLELVGEARVADGNALANRLSGNAGDNILRGMAGDDTLYGGAGNDTLSGGPGSDGYVYLPGDGNDVIIEDGGDADVDELILGGGIAPAQVSLYRPSHTPDDLVLTLDTGGHILIKDFFKGPSSAIERIVFDRAPAWEGDALRRLAASAPIRDDALPTLHVPTTYAGGSSLETASHADTADTVLGDSAGSAPSDGLQHAPELWLGLEALASWLF
jgi:Ca2+-binding RTX toxin-like protein